MLRTAFSLALNQEGWVGGEGWAKCSVQANRKSKIIMFAFFHHTKPMHGWGT